MPDVTGEAPDARPAMRLSPTAFFAIGLGSGLLGLLPWLITGARLPLQNLGRGTSTDMPFALLPFNQYYLLQIVALIVVGSAVAGVAGRTLAVRDVPFGTQSLVGGVLLVQLIAGVQASVVTAVLLESSTRAALYLSLVIAVLVVALLVGLLVLLQIARSQVPGATIGLSLAALVTPSWIGTALGDFFTYGSPELVPIVSLVLQWMPAVLVGVAIAWCGFRTAGRIAAVAVSLLALWIGPAFFAGVSNAAGTRALFSQPRELIDFGVSVFVSALRLPEVVLPSLVVAVAIGAAGNALLALRRHPSPVAPG